MILSGHAPELGWDREPAPIAPLLAVVEAVSDTAKAPGGPVTRVVPLATAGKRRRRTDISLMLTSDSSVVVAVKVMAMSVRFPWEVSKTGAVNCCGSDETEKSNGIISTAAEADATTPK